MNIRQLTLIDVEPDPDYSPPCAQCGRKWLLAMDDSGICPRCGHINNCTFLGQQADEPDTEPGEE